VLELRHIAVRTADSKKRRLLVELETLLERCRAGDDLAWEALVRGYQGRVYAVAYNYMRNREEARDVAQEIFIRIYRQLHTVQGGEKFLPWLLRLSRNACIDRLRRRKARPPASDIRVEDGPQIAASGPSPEESSSLEARKRLLYRALEGMSGKNREIIMLKEIQGLKLEEISTMLALPIGTVKSRSNRARLDLAARVRRLDPSYGAGEA
jgi:RNA polymerase sigma-70 factor (ECF subfamily)